MKPAYMGSQWKQEKFELFFYTGSVALYLVHGNQGNWVLKTGDALTEQL